jgi:nitrite reductase/ring-hydroxylating ferredoxin subunit
MPSSDTTPLTPTADTLIRDGFQRIGQVSELEPHGQFSKWVEDHDLLVCRYEGELKVYTNICPHFGGPVGYHKINEGKFVCLWHNYEFAAKDGSCLTNRHFHLREYRSVEKDGEIWVRLVEPVENQIIQS